MTPETLTDVIDVTAQAILEAAQLDGLPLMGKLWTLRVEGDEILLRIGAGLNNTEVPRQPPPPPPDPEPEPAPPPPPPTDRAGA
jgi:hypothetical protein